MRKFLLAAAAGLLAVPALASAQDSGSGYGSDVNQQQQPGMQGQTQDQGIEQPGELGQFPEQGSEVRTAAPSDVQAQSQQLFQGKVKAWDVQGTVTNVDPTNHEITIQRPNLPDAQLSLVDGTRITYDGKQASLMEIQPGAEVRAEFQLAQDKPVAMKVDAKPSKAQKSMQKGSSGGMQQDSGSSGGMQH